MKLNIPKIGSYLELEEDWELELHSNAQSYDFLNVIFGENFGYRFCEMQPFTLKINKGTIFRLVKINCRARTYHNDVTFVITKSTNAELQNKRLYVGIHEAVKADFKEVEKPKPIKKPKKK